MSLYRLIAIAIMVAASVTIVVLAPAQQAIAAMFAGAAVGAFVPRSRVRKKPAPEPKP